MKPRESFFICLRRNAWDSQGWRRAAVAPGPGVLGAGSLSSRPFLEALWEGGLLWKPPQGSVHADPRLPPQDPRLPPRCPLKVSHRSPLASAPA